MNSQEINQGRFDVGDEVTAPGKGVGIIKNKKIADGPRLVGSIEYIYQIQGGGFDPDEWYSESTLMLPK